MDVPENRVPEKLPGTMDFLSVSHTIPESYSFHLMYHTRNNCSFLSHDIDWVVKVANRPVARRTKMSLPVCRGGDRGRPPHSAPFQKQPIFARWNPFDTVSISFCSFNPLVKVGWSQAEKATSWICQLPSCCSEHATCCPSLPDIRNHQPDIG